jgi:predicted metal-dependent hydrolase
MRVRVHAALASISSAPTRNPDGAYISDTALADFVAGHARRQRSASSQARLAEAARGRADHKEHDRHARRFR